jgi:Right handed beta helix region
VRLLLLVIFSVGALAANAADYYVSPSGNDGFTGTNWAQAWRTISNAVMNHALSPGDTVHLQPGATFTENVYILSSGNAASPVNILCDDPTNRATIQQASSKSSAFLLWNVEYLRLQNLVFTGLGAMTANKFYGLDVESSKPCGGIVISNVAVSGFYAGISFWSSTNNGFHDVLITGCNVYSNLDVGGEFYSDVFGAFSNIVVRNCIFHDNYGDPSIYKNTGSGLVLSAVVDGLVDGCVAHDNGGRGNSEPGPAGLWVWNCQRITMQHCESYHNLAKHQDGDGYDFDLGTSDSVIQYCYAHDNYGAGFLLSTDGSLRVWSNNIVRFCISENDATGRKMGALHFYSPGGPQPLHDSQIYNNTIFNSRGPVIWSYETTNMFNLTVRNNLFIASNNVALMTNSLPDISLATNQAIFQGNDYWASGGILKLAGYTSLAAWRADTGQETLCGTNVGFSVNPQLNNPGHGGTNGVPGALANLVAYQLQTNSPMIGTGLDLRDLFGTDPGPVDFFGTAVPASGNMDLGAAMFVRSDDLTPPVLLTGSAIYAGGAFQMSFTGTSGQTYQVLTSTNMINWSPTASGTFTGSPVTFTNPTPNDAQRFYRLVSP